MFSCGKSYYYISDEEKALFVYELEDTFSILLEPILDTIMFHVTSSDNFFQDEAGVLTPENFVYETIELQFENGDGYSGMMIKSMMASPSNIGIEIKKGLELEFYGDLNDTLLEHTLNGKRYPELYVFSAIKGQSPMLYFTKEEGIVYIDSTASDNSYTLIEYIKNE